MLVQDIMSGGQATQSAVRPSVLRVGLENLAASVSVNMMPSVSDFSVLVTTLKCKAFCWRDGLLTMVH